jgi:GNAT superfamily N-acetyltransferase
VNVASSALGFLPVRWSAGPVRLVEATPADEPRVAAVYEDLADLLPLLGEQGPGEVARAEVRHRHLPPGGDARNERTFRVDDTDGRTVGVLSVYGGYPSPATIYIGSLFLVKARQRGGDGRRIVRALERRAADAGYRETRAAVGLRNWPALRFWTRVGYTRVTNVAGDAEFGEGRHAVIELARRLSRRDDATRGNRAGRDPAGEDS